MCNVHMRMCVYIGYMWYTGVEHMYTACIHMQRYILISVFSVLIAVLVYNAV